MEENYDIILKTFLRSDKLEKCLSKMLELDHTPNLVVISDDGPPSTTKDELYSKYQKLLNLNVLKLPFDAGISRSRNEAFHKTTSPHILLIDDDHYLPSNIFQIKDVLDADSQIGGVSPYWNEYGDLFCGASDLSLSEWVIRDVKHPKKSHQTKLGVEYYLFDLIPNTTLFRRECLDDLLWDEAFIIGGEHLDFYLEHKKLGKWKFAVSPNFTVKHDPKSDDTVYNKNRTSKEKITNSMNHLVQKHNIKGYLTFETFLPKDKTRTSALRRWIKKHVIPKEILWAIQQQDQWFNYRTRNRQAVKK